MKKTNFLILMLIVAMASFALSSCSDDDEPSFDSPYAKDIIGTWRVTDYGSPNYWIAWDRTRTTATFNPNGTYSGRGFFGNGEGTYNLSGSTITCYIDGQVYMKYDIVSVKEDIAVLTLYVGNSDTSNMSLRCKKVM